MLAEPLGGPNLCWGYFSEWSFLSFSDRTCMVSEAVHALSKGTGLSLCHFNHSFLALCSALKEGAPLPPVCTREHPFTTCQWLCIGSCLSWVLKKECVAHRLASIWAEGHAHRLVTAWVFCCSSSGTFCWEIKIFKSISVSPLITELVTRYSFCLRNAPVKYRWQHGAPAEPSAKHFVT